MKQLKSHEQVLLLTHNDLDGYGSRILAEHIFGPTEGILEVLHLNNNEVDSMVLEMLRDGRLAQYDYIYMTDLNISEFVAEEISRALELDAIKSFVLLDHHKHALFLDDYPWAIVRVNHAQGILASGTSLFYEILKSEWQVEPTAQMDHFVRMVRLYDTWEWFNVYNEVEPKQLNDLFGIYGGEDFTTHCLNYLKSPLPMRLLDSNARHILDVEMNRIERYYNEHAPNMAVSEFLGHSCGLIFAEQYHSEMGSRLHHANQELDMIAIINPNEKKISFRTIHDHVDVSRVAVFIKGGGHSKAAGAPLTEDILDWAKQAIFK